MAWDYWLLNYADVVKGARHRCVVSNSVEGAALEAAGPLVSPPERISFEWFKYSQEGEIPDPKNVGRRLRELFFEGHSIGCEIKDYEFMFVPKLLDEPKEVMIDGEDHLLYGEAEIRIKDHPEMGYSIFLEGLDDAHLIDRLSTEAVKTYSALTAPHPAQTEVASITKALHRVIELAESGMLELADEADPSVKEVRDRQLTAIDTVRSFSGKCQHFIEGLTSPVPDDQIVDDQRGVQCCDPEDVICALKIVVDMGESSILDIRETRGHPDLAEMVHSDIASCAALRSAVATHHDDIAYAYAMPAPRV